MNKNLLTLTLCVVSAALLIHGFCVYAGLRQSKEGRRYISVKGFAEREVKADFAIWTMKTKIVTNNIVKGSEELLSAKTKIRRFLVQNGLSEQEIIDKNTSVQDKLSRDYEGTSHPLNRYIISTTLQVRSAQVDLVQKVQTLTSSLLGEGVVLASEYDDMPSVSYVFTKLSDIKPEMLAEASTNAKMAATELAKNTGVRLQHLSKATQGMFSIVERDASFNTQSEGGSGYASESNLYKKVKVIISVEYEVE